MRWGVVVVMLLVGVASFSCKEDAVAPPLEPPGRQHDIPWPSLADSPWPMYQADPQHTGRSRYPGPQEGMIVQAVEFFGNAKGSYVSIGPEGTVYFVTSASGLDSVPSAYLYALSSDGSLKWRTKIWSLPWPPGDSPEVHNAPTIAADGTVYIGSEDGFFYAVDPGGSIKWAFNTQTSQISNSGTGALIGLDGTIYFTDGEGLRSLHPDGNEKWFLAGYSGGVPLFFPDGQTLLVSRQDELTSLGLDGSIAWKFQGPSSFPIIDSEGHVYFGSDTLVYSLNPNGSIRWVVTTKPYGARLNPTISPTIDKDGNLYFDGSESIPSGAVNVILSFDYDGKFRWKVPRSGTGFTADLTCDARGTLYYSSSSSQVVGAVSAGGLPVWELSNIGQFIFSNVALSKEGYLYVTTHPALDDQPSRVYAIK